MCRKAENGDVNCKYFWGGLDKRVLAKDKHAIEEVFGKVPPMLEKGGFIPAIDQAVPPTCRSTTSCSL